MDGIDIIDPTFSLDKPAEIINSITSVNSVDTCSDSNSTYIFMGIVALLGIIVYMLYTKFFSKKTNVDTYENRGDVMDCEGGFCTMNKKEE